jgi:putative transposase
MPLCHVYYHFVWATHNRLPLISANRETALYSFIRLKTGELSGTVYAIGGVEDHLHLIAAIPPSVALSEYIQRVKGSSSRYINMNYPDPNATFKWQQEYGVFSISKRNLDKAMAYVQNQKHHHATGTIIPSIEPEALLNPSRP